MWQRFTERARKCVYYAQEEAQKFGEGYVSTEHLLLGLTDEPDSMACRVLERMGISLSRIRAEVEKQLPRGDARPSPDMTLTPRAKRVIDLSYDEARHMNNNYIGTEHLLLGLIREGDGLAGRILAKIGIGLENARNVILEIRAEVNISMQQAAVEIESQTRQPKAEAEASASTKKPLEKEIDGQVAINALYTHSIFGGTWRAAQYDPDDDQITLINTYALREAMVTGFFAVVTLTDFNEEWFKY